jgi:ABC-type amino acid transport substrate-binding protein
MFTIICLLFLLTFGCASKEKAPDAMERMNKYKQVSISTDAVHLPFEFGLDATVQGLDIDIGNEIAKDLGLEPRWLNNHGYEHQLDLMRNGEVEMIISAMAVDPKLEGEFAFSQPYFDSADGIARRFDNNDIKDLASLSLKKVGVATGRPGDAFMASQKTAANVTITKFPNLDNALGALNRKEIDAVVGDEPIMVFSAFKSFQNLTVMSADINKYQYAVVVRKGDAALLEKINKTLNRIKESGELAAMKQKWFQDVLEKALKQQEQHDQEEALRRAPKRINVSINKISGDFKMDRLDGYVLVLDGPSGRYQSDQIYTTGNKGTCKFNTPVPPGEYKLDMKIFKTTATVTVQEYPKTTLSMVMDVSKEKGISIDLK